MALSPNTSCKKQSIFVLYFPSLFLFSVYFSSLSGDYMSKKGKEVLEPSPYAYEEDAKARRKHKILMQDFLELEKETESMKKRLEMAKERKRVLSAQVRFLRRRYKYLTKYPSAIFPPEQDHHPTHPQNSSRVRLKSSSRKARNFKTKQTSPVLDLNQISAPVTYPVS